MSEDIIIFTKGNLQNTFRYQSYCNSFFNESQAVRGDKLSISIIYKGYQKLFHIFHDIKTCQPVLKVTKNILFLVF